jgi:hypothetical protein
MLRRVAVSLVLLLISGLIEGSVFAVPAAAQEPRRSTFSGHFTNTDFFAGTDVPHCAFAVVGDWDITVTETDFFDQTTGNVSLAIVRIEFTGTLSNPLSGKSILDSSHQDQLKFYFDSDGNLVKTVENESRDDPYLGFHFHEVSGADGTVLKDVGRDILFENKHPFSIEPLCQALASGE